MSSGAHHGYIKLAKLLSGANERLIGLQRLIHHRQSMEYSVDGWLATDVREDVVISAKGQELFKRHLVAVGITVPWIDIIQCTEQFTHEIDHDF